MKVYREEDNPIFERGEGVYLYDIYGRKYIDAISSLWCNVHGHNHPRLNNALIKQLCKVAHTTTLGSSNIPSIILAKRLVEITPPCLTKVFYSEDGAEANEIALKMAYHYFYNKGERERKYFITLSNAYHGDTIGAVSVGGIEIFHNAYKPLLFKTFKLPSPYRYCKEKYGELCDECKEDLLNRLRNILETHHGEVIGIILESGIQAAAGMLPYPKGFLKGVEKLSKEFGVFFIVDEVATGFGRTGTLFYVEQEGVCPDFMTLGKGITGGYLPLAVTLTTEEVFNAFLGDFGEAKHFYHGHTYTGNNLACAVAIENLNIFEEEKTLEELQPKISHLAKRLEEFKELPWVYDIRRLGFMAGIELRRRDGEPFPYGDRIGFKVAYKARKRGVFFRPLGDVMVLMMPLVIEIGEIDHVLDTLKWAIEDTLRAF